MSDASAATVLALVRADPRPGHQVAEDLDAGADPAVLLRHALTADPNGQLALTPAPDPAGLINAARDALTAWADEGIATTSVLDSNYPANLRAVHDRPPIVFSRGRLDALPERAVSVIGTRRPTEHGRELASETAEHLIHAGYTVVSGLAAGIDTAAHAAALHAGTETGTTAAVIGTGLRHCYPPENAALQTEIVHRGGVVISPFEPDTPPSSDTFPIRNGVMSGLTLASVIVEAGERSGTRIQARLALGHGRAVFLSTPLLVHTWARDLAAKPGVYTFEAPADITETLGRRLAATPLTL